MEEGKVDFSDTEGQCKSWCSRSLRSPCKGPVGTRARLRKQALELCRWTLRPDSRIWGGAVEAAIGAGTLELALRLSATLPDTLLPPGQSLEWHLALQGLLSSLVPVLTVVFSGGGGRPVHLGSQAPGHLFLVPVVCLWGLHCCLSSLHLKLRPLTTQLSIL